MADLTGLAPATSEFDISRPTAADLSALQYTVVKHNTSEKVVACGANEKSLGILQNKPDGSTNEATAHVRTGGLSLLKIAEAVVQGNYLTCTAAGLGEVADAANEEIVAKALTSGDANDLILVKITEGKDTDGNG